MAEIKIAGIMRAGAYSPNHIGNDAAIFTAVTEQLRKRGCEVNVYSEEQLNSEAIREDVIINMCREWRSIVELQRLEEQGKIVINSGYGIENCTHARMVRILTGSNIPYPESLVVNTNEVVKDQLVKQKFARCWVKRGDFHSIHKEDMSLVRTADEAQDVLKEYFLRGIERAVISKHLEGEHVKFYGVQDTPFFYWFLASEGPHPRSMHDSVAQRISFDVEKLRALAMQASEELDIKVYGGDCIVAPDGDITIIDFNDWPSFAPCRDEAAVAIAKCVIAQIKKRKEGTRK